MANTNVEYFISRSIEAALNLEIVQHMHKSNSERLRGIIMFEKYVTVVQINCL